MRRSSRGSRSDTEGGVTGNCKLTVSIAAGIPVPRVVGSEIDVGPSGGTRVIAIVGNTMAVKPSIAALRRSADSGRGRRRLCLLGSVVVVLVREVVIVPGSTKEESR